MSEKIYSLLDEIELNQLVVPEFQREFIWTLSQSQELMRSLFNSFPTGSLLFWKTTEPPALKNEKVSREAGSVKVILDGQQRLTTLYLLIKDKIPPYYKETDINYDPRNLYVDLKTGVFMYYKPSEMAGKPNWISVADCFRKKINVVEIANKMLQPSEDPMDLITILLNNYNNIEAIKNMEYPIQYLPPNADLKDAVEVFDKVNSQGTPLTEAEIALAYVTSHWKEARRELKRKIEELEKHGFQFNLDFLVRCLTGVTTGRAMYNLMHNVKKEKLMESWHKLSKLLDYVISHIKGMFIHSSDDLNTPNVLVPFIVYINKKGFSMAKAELRKIQRWLYLALIWRRYTSQTTQKLEHDLSLLDDPDPFEKLVDEIITERGRVELQAEDLEQRGVSNPIYPMLKILLRKNEAVDWSNGGPLFKTVGRAFSINAHHIFPKSQLYKEKYDSKSGTDIQKVNEIANLVIVTSEANMDFFTDLPEKYLPVVQERYPNELEKQYIPKNEKLWKLDNYEEFLKERRNLIAQAINKFIDELPHEKSKEVQIEEILENDEGLTLEYKETLRYDIKTKTVNKELELECLETICSFLNAEGGTLLIGVDDNKNVKGLERDYSTLPKRNSDGFENHLGNLIESRIGPFFFKFIRIDFPIVRDKEICRVTVYHSTEPAYYEKGLNQKFFVRGPNGNRRLSYSDANKYIKDTWG